jgi:ribosomal protein S18 acetylase RimI-like enzyme
MATAHRDEVKPPVPLDLADDATAREVLAIQRDAYTVEAALIGSDAIPALTETLDELRAAPEDWLGVADDDGLAGAVSWRELGDGTVDIHRLVVAPRAFRRGVASALLDELDRRFPNRPMVVSTGRANEPALRLYARRGFTVLREREVVPGLVIAELGRGRSRNGEAPNPESRVV